MAIVVVPAEEFLVCPVPIGMQYHSIFWDSVHCLLLGQVAPTIGAGLVLIVVDLLVGAVDWVSHGVQHHL